MGARSRRSGQRAEREIVQLFRKLGLEAYRVPLSGSAEGYRGDVVVPDLWEGPVECKYGTQVPSSLYKWIADNQALAVRGKRQEWLVVLRWQDFARLVERVLPGEADRGDA